MHTLIDDCSTETLIQWGADRSLARPGRKHATANQTQDLFNTLPTKLSILLSSFFLTFASHSKKNSEGCPSNQVSAAGMTSASEEKW